MKAPSPQLLRALRSAIGNTGNGLRSICQSKILVQPMARAYSTSVHQQDELKSLATRTTPAAATQMRQGNRFAPASKDRGPASKEDTQTDFGVMDVLGNIPAPATSIDACTSDGFHLDNGVKTEGGSGILLVGGEAFTWEPWQTLARGDGVPPRISDLLDARRGVLSIPVESLKLLELLHPKPDLFIIGTGARLWMLSKETREYITDILGCRIDMMDTGNASSAYNLLAKERGVEGGAGVGALMLPMGWTGLKAAPKRVSRTLPKT